MTPCLASSRSSSGMMIITYLTIIIWCCSTCCWCSESTLMVQQQHPTPTAQQLQQLQQQQQLQHQQQQREEMDNEEQLSSYGERLAESSYSFSNAFVREPKEEQSIYSAGINAIMNSDGFLNQMEKFTGHDGKYSPQGPVEMAVHSKKTVEVIPVKFEDGDGGGEPQVIEISPYEVPVSIVFKTQTNKLHVNQEHKTEPAEEVKEINSEEEPQRVVHNVYRPVIQEVTEVVQPYRKVVQKVEPVIEEMKTIISKAAPQDGGATMSAAAPKSIGQSFFGQPSSSPLSSLSSGGFKGFGGGGMGGGYGGSGGGGGSGGYGMASNKLGRFSDFPLSQIPYGSEVVNKLAIPPSMMSTANNNNNGNYLMNTINGNGASSASSASTSSLFPSSIFRSNSGSYLGENHHHHTHSPHPLPPHPNIAHRFGTAAMANRSSHDASNNSSSFSNVSKLEPMILDQNQNRNNNNKESGYQYNDIIKQYISNILNIKNDHHKHHHQQSAAAGVAKSMSMLNNANGIKFINLPLKYTPKILGATPSSSSSSSPYKADDNTKSNDGQDEKNGKKFKVIKEFRISLNDIKKELGKVQPATVSTSASGVATPNNAPNNQAVMMKPFASFSVSGVSGGNPAQYSRHQTLQDISNKIIGGGGAGGVGSGAGANNEPPTSIKRSSRKPDGSEKLSQFSRRSRRNMNNIGPLNQNQNPLRNYHYMNLKRGFGDETPTPLPSPSASASSSSNQNNGRFRRRMMMTNNNGNNNNNDGLVGLASEHNLNLYSMNIHRRPRRPMRRFGMAH